YVAGHMGSGSFALDGSIDLSGKWKVTKVEAKSGTSVGNLLTASNLLGGANASTTNVGFYDVINFGRSTPNGLVGSDAGFPGGWSENFAMEARGSIWVNVAGNQSFVDYTDDGSSLFIDGTALIVDDHDHAAGGIGQRTRSLTRGLHSVYFMMWNGNGDASAEVWDTHNNSDYGSGVWTLVKPTGLPDTQNKGYVVKFSGPNFSTLKGAYFSTTESTGSG